MRNTRAFVMIAVALVLALGAVVVAAHWITDQGAATSKKVAVALVDIAPGTRITPAMVNLVDWPANAMPPGAITDVKQLDTRVSRNTIEHGEPIMESKLAALGTTGGLSAVVAQGKRAMTVRVNDVVGVAGFALPGNFVDILVNTQEEARGDTNNNQPRDQAISKIVLERILGDGDQDTGKHAADIEAKVVTLDRASEALTNGSALHVHLLAHSEQFSDRQSSASSVLASHFGRHGEFAGHFTGFNTCLSEVAGLWLGHARSAA